jgi:hypothetical protein
MIDLAKQFCAAVDRIIPQEIDGFPVSTDVVVGKVGQPAMMQWYLVGDPNFRYGVVFATKLQLEANSETIDDLARRAWNVSWEVWSRKWKLDGIKAA